MQRRNNKQVFASLFARVCWSAIAHAEITRVNFRFSEKTARKFSSGRATQSLYIKVHLPGLAQSADRGDQTHCAVQSLHSRALRVSTVMYRRAWP